MNKDDLQEWLDETVVNGETYDELSRTLAESKNPEEWFAANSSTLKLYPGYNKFAKQTKPLDERFKSELGKEDWEKASKAFRLDVAKALGVDESELDKVFKDLSEKQELTNKFQSEEQAKFDRKKLVDDYVHSYLGMDERNPVNKALNAVADFVISDDTRKAVAEDPNNSGRIAGNAAVDIVGSTGDILPGVPGVVIGPTLRTGRNIAEGKEIDDIAGNAVADYGSNFALEKGLKAFIPGLRGRGAAQQVEDIFPFRKWAEKARRAEKAAKTSKEIDKSVIPVFSSEDEARRWANTLEDEAIRNKYLDLIYTNRGKPIVDLNKALGVQEKEIKDNLLKQYWKDLSYKESKEKDLGNVKSMLGIGYEDLIRGTERVAAQKGQSKVNSKMEQKIENPSKIQGKYDKALDYIIRRYESDWENGKNEPSTENKLVHDAWLKWKGVK